MKRLFFLACIIMGGCTARNSTERETLPLAGEWVFRIDSLDKGRQEAWFLQTAGETITLPGSMAENGKGDDVSLNTPWTGDIIDKSYFTDDKYAIYREAGNIKIPFWLKPVKYYKGAAWYLKEFELPGGWSEKSVTLFLERPHWETEVYINGKKAGSRNSLAVPHRYDISELLNEGRNIISIRVDNRMILPIGVNSHSVSDHTQSNWNGIAGDISLRASSKALLENVAIYPDADGNKADLVISLSNKTGKQFNGTITIQAESTDPASGESFKKVKLKASAPDDTLEMKAMYMMGPGVQKWSEYNPAVYRLVISLSDEDGRVIDRITEDFGMREFTASGTRFNVNGQPVFLRGTTECCIFPLTGYPPSDTASWMRILRICRNTDLTT
jgi:beta-galactosidase/beta-glucuronidase